MFPDSDSSRKPVTAVKEGVGQGEISQVHYSCLCPAMIHSSTLSESTAVKWSPASAPRLRQEKFPPLCDNWR